MLDVNNSTQNCKQTDRYLAKFGSRLKNDMIDQKISNIKVSGRRRAGRFSLKPEYIDSQHRPANGKYVRIFDTTESTASDQESNYSTNPVLQRLVMEDGKHRRSQSMRHHPTTARSRTQSTSVATGDFSYSSTPANNYSRPRGASEPSKEQHYQNHLLPDPRIYVSNKTADQNVDDIENNNEDVTRTRIFSFDASGALINRGDSFRRRCTLSSSSGYATGYGTEPTSPRNSVFGSGGAGVDFRESFGGGPLPFSSSIRPGESLGPAAGTVPKYDIIVLGADEVGKRSMIKQFMSSDYRNAFSQDASDVGDSNGDETVNIMVDGEESELIFYAVNPTKNDLWQSISGAGYIVVYAVNNVNSYRCAQETVYNLREQAHTSLKPIVLVGNKIDLERQRVVSCEDAKCTAKENDCKFVEISVALNHNVDRLLVGILTQAKQQAAAMLASRQSSCTVPPLTDLQHGVWPPLSGGSPPNLSPDFFSSTPQKNDPNSPEAKKTPLRWSLSGSTANGSHKQSSSGVLSLSMSPFAKKKLAATNSAQFGQKASMTSSSSFKTGCAGHWPQAGRNFLHRLFSGKHKSRSKSVEDLFSC